MFLFHSLHLLLLLLFSFMYIGFAGMYVCAHLMGLVPIEIQKGHQSLWN